MRQARGSPAPGERPVDAVAGVRAAGSLAAVAGMALLLAAVAVPCGAPLAAAGPRDAAPPQEAAPSPADAAADSSDLEARSARLADQLRCPVCRSQSVLESSSRLAREMKAEIRRRLAEGQSPEQVKAYFVSRYGEWILLRPEAEGLNLMVYVLPPLLLLGGGLLVWGLLRRWSPRVRDASEGEHAGRSFPPAADAAAPTDQGLSAEEERRLEEALREDAGA